MRIVELIERLSLIERHHGNLTCLTPGFDECGYDEVRNVGIVMAVRDTEWHENRVAAEYDEPRKGEGDGKPYAFINW